MDKKSTKTPASKKAAKTLAIKKAAKTLASKKATKAPADKKATKAPADKKATKAPADKKATKAPADKKATKTPADKKATTTPEDKKATKAPADKKATKAPEDKKATKAPTDVKANKTPVGKKITKNLLNKKSTKTLVLLGILLCITVTLCAMLVYRLFNPHFPQTIYDVQVSPAVSPSEVCVEYDEEEPELPDLTEPLLLSEENDDAQDDESYEDLEREEFTFENGVEGLEELEALLLAHIEPLWGNFSIYVKNLDTNEYLLINNRRQDSASLIKLFNFVYAFEKSDNGSLELTSFIEQWLYLSIVVSCNNSYNQLLAAIGYGSMMQGAISSTEFAHSQGFEDTIVGGSLHPSDFDIVGFSNIYTSALDVGHLLENIYRGTMVSEEASGQMLDILLAQQRLNKIPAGLPEGTITASKTGEIGGLEHDAAIVFAEHTHYVIVIMTEYASSAIYNIQQLSRLVYDYFALASTAT